MPAGSDENIQRRPRGGSEHRLGLRWLEAAADRIAIAYCDVSSFEVGACRRAA